MHLRQGLVGVATKKKRTAGGFPLAWPDTWHPITVNTHTKHAETVELESSCPRCGHGMTLALPADTDQADAQRLASLILCDACMAWPGWHRGQPWDAPVRLPL